MSANLTQILRSLAICMPLVGLSSQLIAEAKAIPASRDDGGPRRLEVITDQVTLHSGPSTESEQITVLPQGTVLSNFGCVLVERDHWCAVAPFRGGPRGHVLARHIQSAEGPDGQIATGPDDSKARARAKDFDEVFEIRCAQEHGQELGKCKAAVARSGGGDATVVVTFANGFSRQLYFTHGEFLRGSATMSGVGTDMEWQMTQDTYIIRVDDQKFEIPSAFVVGN